MGTPPVGPQTRAKMAFAIAGCQDSKKPLAGASGSRWLVSRARQDRELLIMRILDRAARQQMLRPFERNTSTVEWFGAHRICPTFTIANGSHTCRASPAGATQHGSDPAD